MLRVTPVVDVLRVEKCVACEVLRVLRGVLRVLYVLRGVGVSCILLCGFG